MAGEVRPAAGVEMQPLGPIPARTRVRLSDAQVQAVAQRADDLFRRRASLNADEQRVLRQDEKTLESVLEGRVVTQTGAAIAEETITKIRRLEVVRTLESAPSQWVHEMTTCHEYFASSKYLNAQLARANDPEHPLLGDYLEGANSMAVIQGNSSSGPRKARVEGVYSLEIELTPLPDEQKFRVTVTAPKGKGSLFGGVRSSVKVYNSIEEAKRAIDGVLKQANALSADEACLLGQELMLVSIDGLASHWASKIPGGFSALSGGNEALRLVHGSPRPGSMRCMLWKTKEPRRKTAKRFQAEYFLVAEKEGQPPKNYKLKVATCPWNLWNRHPRPVVIDLGGGKEDILPLEDLEHQEARLKTIFGVSEIDFVSAPQQ